MKRGWPVVFLVLGAVFCVLFWITDPIASAVGRGTVHSYLSDAFRGDSSHQDSGSDPLASLSFPLRLAAPLFSQRLSGLRLRVLVRPFHLKGGEGSFTYAGLGTWVLRVEVEGATVWVMQDRNHSSVTPEQPINNVNLLTVLAPMMVQMMAPQIPPGALPEPAVSLENKSIVERVSTAYDVTEAILAEQNITVQNNSLEAIHRFLTAGGDAALAVRGFSLEVGEREITTRRKRAVFSLAPLSLSPLHYCLPGREKLTLEYWRSGESGLAGLHVDQYALQDVWKPDILSQLSGINLLGLYKRVQEYGVFLTLPSNIESNNFNMVASEAPPSVVLDVYRPFATPIAGEAAVQLNFHIPGNDSFGSLQGERTPAARVVVTLDELPDGATDALVFYLRVRTILLLVFLTLCCFFLLAAFLSFVTCRTPRRVQTRAFHSTPL